MNTTAHPARPEHEPATDDPALQGEGNYDAARRHRESVETFVESGRVDEAARDAEPKDADEERELEDAEAEGRSHAKR